MGFLSKIRNNMRKKVSRMPSRGRRSVLTGLRIPKRRNPLEDLIAGGRLPQPIPERMPSVDDGRFYAGGSPGLYKPGGKFYNPEARLKMPQPIARKDPSALERLPMGEAPSFNPTIFGQPIGDMDFSQMPKISPEDIMNLQVPTDMPMTQDLPEVSPVGMMPQPRMMMSKGGLTAAAMAAGRNLPGRMKDLSNKILGKDKKTLKDQLKIEAKYYGFDNTDDFLKYIDKNAIEASKSNKLFRGEGFQGKPTNLAEVFKNKEIRMSQNRNIPGTASLNDRLRRGTENAIIGGGLLGGAAVTDATQGFTEQASMQNMMLNSPEQLGKDLAGMRIGLDKLIDIASQKAQEIGAAPGEYVGRAQRAYEAEMEAERMQQIDAEEGLKNVSLLMAEGGEADSDDFPDLTGDGKVTQADILKGRGVYAEGDEVMMMEETEMMAPGGDEIEASLMEVQDIQPEMQALDQYVQMVIEMIQAGASEAEVIESLRQAGLDDEDIEALFQAVMETLQSNMEQGGIDAELAQIS